MAGEQLQQVVQKAAPGVYLVAAGAVQIKGKVDLVSLVLRSSEIIRFGMVHSSMILSSVSINVCICSGVPMVMRSQFWMRGASKWRTRMPFFFNSL